MQYLIILTLFLLVPALVAAEAPKKASKDVEFTEEKRKEISRKFPPLKTGFLVDLDPTDRDGFFYFGLEAYAWKLLDQRWSIDVGVASGRVLSGIGLGVWFDGAVGPFVWGGYNIPENAAAWGIGFNMLKL